MNEKVSGLTLSYLARKCVWWMLVFALSFIASEILWPFAMGFLFNDGNSAFVFVIVLISFIAYLIVIELVFSPSPRVDNYYIVTFTAFWVVMATKAMIVIRYMFA